MNDDPSQAVMFCPACVRTKYQLLNADCPICEGAGSLRLGKPALYFYDAETVAMAVRFALEVGARKVVETTTLSDPRASLLQSRVRRLVDAGLLFGAGDVPPPGEGGTARDLAESVTGEQLTLFDMNVADPNLPPYEYQATDRPRARGLPVLSDGGHPSAVLLICDPADPFGSTVEDVTAHRRRSREARVLKEAYEDAARRRRAKVAS